MKNLPSGYRRTSAKELAYFGVKEQILNGKLRPGETIREDELSEEMRISRTPLREAIQRLEIESLVLRLPNGRSKVTKLSVEEVREIYGVLLKLEEVAFKEAIDHMSDDDIEQLEEIVRHIERSYHVGNNIDILYHVEDFHEMIYELSRNHTIKRILSQLNDNLHRYWQVLLYPKQEAVEERYREILDQIKEKNKRQAKKSVKSQIQLNMESIIEGVKQHHITDEKE